MVLNNETIIIDYGAGNLQSLKQAFVHLGKKVVITDEHKVITKATHLVLPGVGAFKNGMNLLKKHNLIEVIREAAENKKSILGIYLLIMLLPLVVH